MPETNGTIIYQRALAEAFKQFYHPKVGDHVRRFGRTTRLVKMSDRKMEGRSMEVTVKDTHNRSSRPQRDLLAPPPEARPGRYLTFEVKFRHDDPDNNDFTAYQIYFRTTDYDMKKKGEAILKDRRAGADIIRKDIEEGLADIREEIAASIHLSTTGLLATVSSKKAADSDILDSAGAYSTSMEALVGLNRGPIAHIGEGDLIDIYNGSTLRVSHVEVAYINRYDRSLHLKITDDSVDASDTPVTNLDGVAANDTVYKRDAKDAGATGNLPDFFDPSKTYYGRNRLTAAYKRLMPQRIDAGGGQLNEDWFRALGETVGWLGAAENERNTRTIVMNQDQYRAARRIRQDDRMFIRELTKSDMKDNLGEDGFVMHDPTLGPVRLTIDDFAEYGKISALEMDTWEMVTPFPGAGAFQWLEAPGGGIWHRNTYNDGSGRPSKEQSAQGEVLIAWVNTYPEANAQIRNLDTSQ